MLEKDIIRGNLGVATGTCFVPVSFLWPDCLIRTVVSLFHRTNNVRCLENYTDRFAVSGLWPRSRLVNLALTSLMSQLALIKCNNVVGMI